MVDLLIATTNLHKLEEYGQIFADLPVKLHSLRDVNIDIDVEETGETFRENALLKAKFYAQESGMLALADDSGLEVAALNGEPGVRSARYAGPGASDLDRINLVLKKLEGVPMHERLARFVCSIALARPDGTSEVVEGYLNGVIEHEPRGDNGFGYDPIFFVLDENATIGELPAERKNQISHRAVASKMALEILKDWLAE
jgi:XTP/dITP diphosphohydrolase